MFSAVNSAEDAVFYVSVVGIVAGLVVLVKYFIKGEDNIKGSYVLIVINIIVMVTILIYTLNKGRLDSEDNVKIEEFEEFEE